MTATLTIREVWRERVWAARPMIRVRDDDEWIAAYMPGGTRWKYPASLEGEPLRVPAEDWALVDGRWSGGGVLHIARPGAAYAVLGFFADGGTLDHWYVNLQEPLRRTAIGFDTMDHCLDIVVSKDLSDWHLKDEEELTHACEAGTMTQSQASLVRAEADRVLEALRRREPPFDGSWEGWSPDPAWPVPELPRTWDEPAWRLTEPVR